MLAAHSGSMALSQSVTTATRIGRPAVSGRGCGGSAKSGCASQKADASG